LTPGESFDDRIQNAVQWANLFIFLISGESLRKGAYSLSELSMAEKRWPEPAGRILPVLLDDTPIELLPAYLRAVSVVQPQGDTVADVLDSVARLSKKRRYARVRAVALVGFTLLIAALGWRMISRKDAISLWKKNPIVSEVSSTPIKGRPNQYRFQMTVNNSSDEGITITDFRPETDDQKVSFHSLILTDWNEFYPREKRAIWADYQLQNETKVLSFSWRICWGYARSLELTMGKDLAGDLDRYDQFIKRYRKEACGPWQVWKPDK
jgi:hypothetical protein